MSGIENVRNNVESAEEFQRKGLEQGKEDVMEVDEAKSILEGMDLEVDEVIIQAVEQTGDALRSEASDHMNSEVQSTLESGYEHANEAISEGTEQEGKSREASAQLEQVAGVSEFGSQTAESASQTAEELGEQFEEYVESAQETKEQTQDDFDEMLDEILG